MFILLVSIAALIYVLNNHLLTYWTKRGFKQLNPTFLVGDAGPVITQKSSIGQFYADTYNKLKHIKICGLYLFYQPVLLVTDTKLVQDILIRDFSSFHDRPMPVNEEKDPLSAHMFNLRGQRWRDLRVKLSPTFTSGKLKTMFPIIKSVGQVLEDYLETNVSQKKNVFEFRDLLARFSTNIISSVAFGIDNDCINQQDHIFRKMGAKIFDTGFGNAVRGLFALLLPNQFHSFGLRIVDRSVEDFFRKVVKETIDYREKNNYSRNDFMQLLIQLKNQGYVSVDKNEKDEDEKEVVNGKQDTKKLTFDELTANVILFFVGGFETTSSTMSFSLFEIARNPEVQNKIQAEIDSVLGESEDGEFTYDNLAKLKYLECVIDEALRKYPIVPAHIRTASHDYELKGMGLTIPKGTGVWIPVMGIQRDPDIYENPMEFIPERFMESSTGGGKAEGVFYMPFGDGPRICIGMRLGKLMTKIGLALILKKFNVSHTDKSFLTNELDFHPAAPVLTPTKPFNLELTVR